MKTIRAKELTIDSIIIENTDRIMISKLDITRRGNIMLWIIGNDGATIKFYNPMDVVVVE